MIRGVGSPKRGYEVKKSALNRVWRVLKDFGVECSMATDSMQYLIVSQYLISATSEINLENRMHSIIQRHLSGQPLVRYL